MKTTINLIFTMIWLSLSVLAQTGGTYDLSHSVIAAGGGSNSTGGTFRVDGTIGQPSAGTVSTGTSPTNNQYLVRGGFWAADALAPTAATVSISGRVTTADGRGIRNVRLTLTDAHGLTRSTQTGSFGNYRFQEIESGQFYILAIYSKNYTFAQPTLVLNVLEELTNTDFVAEPKPPIDGMLPLN